MDAGKVSGWHMLEFQHSSLLLLGCLFFAGLLSSSSNVLFLGCPQDLYLLLMGLYLNVLGFIQDFDVVTLLLGAATLVVLIGTSLRARRAQMKDGVAEHSGLFIGRLMLMSILVIALAVLLSQSAGGTPIVLVIVGALVILYTIVMNYTRFGRSVYAVGGNLKAAKLSGIRTRRVDFLVFVNMGVLAALAGIITTSRAGAAVATAGNTYELDAIAAAYIGGAAVSGGVGKVSGAIVGALVMGVINMGLSILSVDSAWQQAIKGLVVLLAVALDLLTSKRQG